MYIEYRLPIYNKAFLRKIMSFLSLILTKSILFTETAYVSCKAERTKSTG